DHRAIENSVSTNHVWRERKETTGANVGQNAKRHTTRLVYKNTATRNNRFIYANLSSSSLSSSECCTSECGSSECTVILSVMYHSNVSGRFSSGLRSLPSSAPFLSYPSLQSHVFIIFWPNSRVEYSSKLCFHHGDPLQNGTSIRFFRSRVTIFISMSDA
ncbi:hypothetical protein T12_10345, partial [Trichinella patagoniensis]